MRAQPGDTYVSDSENRRFWNDTKRFDYVWFAATGRLPWLNQRTAGLGR